MKCKEAQRFLTGLTSEPLAPDEVEEALRHVEKCEQCAHFVAFNDQVEAALSASPLLNPQLFGRVQGEIALSSRPVPIYSTWMRTFGGFNLMKKLTLTAASAAVLTIAGLGLISTSAQAMEPKAKFNSMRSAVLATAKSQTRGASVGGGIGSTMVQAGVSANGAWILVNGQLVQPDPSGTTRINVAGGRHVTVVTGHDLSSLTPAERAKAEQLLKMGQDASTVIKSHSGQSVQLKGSDGKTVTTKLKPLSLDLDPGHYREIAYGGNPDTLVLTPKSGEGQRYLVNLNSKSALPVFISVEKMQSGKWTPVRRAKIVI